MKSGPDNARKPDASYDPVVIKTDASYLATTDPLPHLLPVKQRVLHIGNANEVTFFIMSVIVMLIINVVFGFIALIFSMRAHDKWVKAKTAAARKQARKLGHIAFGLNVAGILVSMTTIIIVFSTNWIKGHDDE